MQVDASHWLAAAPVSASTLLTPDATPDSEVMINAPMSPVRSTWVPPQSSKEKTSVCEMRVSCPCAATLPMVTTRTCSPYFSPKSAIAPAALALSIAMFSTATKVLSRISLLTIDSIIAN